MILKPAEVAGRQPRAACFPAALLTREPRATNPRFPSPCSRRQDLRGRTRRQSLQACRHPKQEAEVVALGRWPEQEQDHHQQPITGTAAAGRQLSGSAARAVPPPAAMTQRQRRWGRREPSAKDPALYVPLSLLGNIRITPTRTGTHS